MDTSIKAVRDILVERDGITEAEANENIMDCLKEMRDAISNGAESEEIEEIFQDYTGLESDYIIDFLLRT